MTLEIRPTGDPNEFDIYENGERIGEIGCAPPDPDDPADTDPPLWTAIIWSAMGSGKTWSVDGESYEQIEQYAREIYEEFAADLPMSH